MRVALPSPQAATPSKEIVPVLLRLTMREGAVVIRMGVGTGAEPVEFPASELAGRVAAVAGEHGASSLAVALSAEDGVPYEEVVRAHERCVASGVNKIALPPAK